MFERAWKYAELVLARLDQIIELLQDLRKERQP